MQVRSKGEKCVLETFMTAGSRSMRHKWGRKVIQTEKKCNKSIGCRNVWMERETEREEPEPETPEKRRSGKRKQKKKKGKGKTTSKGTRRPAGASNTISHRKGY